MKFTISCDLFRKAVASVSGALIKGNDPSERAQYVIISAKPNVITLTVIQDAISAKTTLDLALTKEWIEVITPGEATVSGEVLYKDLNTYLTNSLMTVEFKKGGIKTPKKASDELSEESVIAHEPVGNLILTCEGAKTTIETTKLQSVAINIDPVMEVDFDSRITIKGKDFADYLSQIDMAVGKAGMNIDYSNVLIRTAGNTMEIVTTNGQQLGRAVFTTEDSKADVSMILPCSLVQAVSKLCDHTRLVTFYSTTGDAQHVIICQDLYYGDSVVGRLQFKIRESAEKFVEFEPLIASLSFVSEAKIKRVLLKNLCSKLGTVSTIKTHVLFDTDQEVIRFKKADAIIEKECALDMFDIKGSKLETSLSSRHLQVAVNVATSEDLEIKFSGEKSLAMLVLSPNLSMYFMPFTANE